ncbi:MAG: hypothetical protein ABEJ28_07485 [Salinigranum sp.]
MDWVTAYHGLAVRAGLYLLLFWPTVAYYVYSDSKDRGLSSPAVRGAAFGLLGILGLLLYLLTVRRTSE